MPSTTVQQAAQAAQDSRDVERVQVATLRTTIEKKRAGFAQALPDHVHPDRFIRAALTAVNVVPRLSVCTAPSVIAGLMQAAQLGLEVADVRGQCYLIPRKDNRAGVYKASFQLGYRGMIDLAARSGITVSAEDVCEGDQLDYGLGSRRFLRHVPSLRGDRGDAYAYYAVATFSDAREPEFKIMGRAQIEEHRDRFASTKTGKGDIVGPWVEHFDAMARKTVIRALLNYLPVSVELRDAIHADVIEATATEGGARPIDYGDATFVFEDPELPDNVDAVTGEIDQMTVVEVPQDEPPADLPEGLVRTPPVTDLATTHLDVTLTWAELRAAAYLGIDRFIRSRARDRIPFNGCPRDDITLDILGAWGECVIARTTDSYLSADTIRPDYGAPDVGPWHVRTNSRPGGDLFLHDSDNDDEPFVLVVPLTLPRFRIVGWCNGRDGKLPEFWQTFTGRPAYFVPQSGLRPFDEWGTS